MLGSRNREQFSIQALLLCDAFLVFQGFYIGDKLRPFLRPLLGLSDDGQIGLAQISWLLFIVVPFTPLVLEVFGFYRNMMRKTLVSVTDADDSGALGDQCGHCCHGSLV